MCPYFILRRLIPTSWVMDILPSLQFFIVILIFMSLFEVNVRKIPDFDHDTSNWIFLQSHTIYVVL
jgi:hypothetical protein